MNRMIIVKGNPRTNKTTKTKKKAPKLPPTLRSRNKMHVDTLPRTRKGKAKDLNFDSESDEFKFQHRISLRRMD